jgi:heme-degrading monooxygenase HmoA
MFAVIFEVEPKPEHWDDYLALAGTLRPELEKIDGFIANERFCSRNREGRILSLSIWRDEKAVIRWRTLAQHYHAQARGRSEIFADYHLRVGEICADSGLHESEAPPLQQRFDETEVGAAKLVTISEFAGESSDAGDLAKELGLPKAGAAGIVDSASFSGINDPQKLLLLVLWKRPSAALLWEPAKHHPGLHHRAVRIIRDYSMHDRREAPQYHPPIPNLRSGDSR